MVLSTTGAFLSFGKGISCFIVQYKFLICSDQNWYHHTSDETQKQEIKSFVVVVQLYEKKVPKTPSFLYPSGHHILRNVLLRLLNV